MHGKKLFGVLAVAAATALASIGCGSSPKKDASSPADAEKTAKADEPAPTSDKEKTGQTSEASTAAPSDGASSATSDPKKEPPGAAEPPGVGNQRKADGQQPGQVGHGVAKAVPKKSKAHAKNDKKKKQAKKK